MATPTLSDSTSFSPSLTDDAAPNDPACLAAWLPDTLGRLHISRLLGLCGGELGGVPKWSADGLNLWESAARLSRLLMPLALLTALPLLGSPMARRLLAGAESAESASTLSLNRSSRFMGRATPLAFFKILPNRRLRSKLPDLLPVPGTSAGMTATGVAAVDASERLLFGTAVTVTNSYPGTSSAWA